MMTGNLTAEGRALLAKGVTLNFTKIQIGDKNSNMSFDIPIRIEKIENGKAYITGVLDLSSVKQGFFWRECGLYAMDPDQGEILYNYAYSTKPDYIASSDSGMMEEILVSMVATVGSNTNVDVTIDTSMVLTTKKEFIKVEGKLNESIISIKDFGAAGDGVTDDTDKIQAFVDHLYESRIYNGFFPDGTYITSKPILVKDDVKLYGQSAHSTRIKKVTLDTLIDGDHANIDAVFMCIKGERSRFDYASGQQFQHLTIRGKSDTEKVGYAIYSKTACPYIQIENVNMVDVETGIQLTRGTWLCRIRNMSITASKTAVAILESSTSVEISNIYAIACKEIAYNFVACGYSHASTLCADWCEGTVYKFRYGNWSVDGCGSESALATTQVWAEQCYLTFNNCAFWGNNTNENAQFLYITSSTVAFNNCLIGQGHDSSTVMPGYLVNQGLESHYTFNNCKITSFSKKQASEIGKTFTVTKKGTPISHRVAGNLSYMGHDRYKIGNLYNTDDFQIPGKAIFLNNKNNPLTTSDDKNRDWANNCGAGDVFLIDNPGKNHHAMYIVDLPNTEILGQGTVSAVNGNLITLSDMSFESELYGNILDKTTYKRYIETSSGAVGHIASVNYDNKQIRLGDMTGTVNVGDTLKMKSSSYMQSHSFSVVQTVGAGHTSIRPTSPVTGQMYFDTTLGKPIWYKGNAVWVDATGATV